MFGSGTKRCLGDGGIPANKRRRTDSKIMDLLWSFSRRRKSLLSILRVIRRAVFAIISTDFCVIYPWSLDSKCWCRTSKTLCRDPRQIYGYFPVSLRLLYKSACLDQCAKQCKFHTSCWSLLDLSFKLDELHFDGLMSKQFGQKETKIYAGIPGKSYRLSLTFHFAPLLRCSFVIVK